MRGKVSHAVTGNSINALQILGDIKLKLAQGENFTMGERQYLNWELERVVGGKLKKSKAFLKPNFEPVPNPANHLILLGNY